MKFRGRMTDQHAIRQFYDILGTMAKLSKVCVLRLSADKLYFVLAEAGGGATSGGVTVGGGPTVWCELQRHHFFAEYNMEGVTAQDDHIYLELEPERLARTLNSLRSASTSPRSLKVKLTRKRETPCLSFELELAPSAHASLASFALNPSQQQGPSSQANRLCTHDVPVSLIPRRLWPDYAEPEMQVRDSYKH